MSHRGKSLLAVAALVALAATGCSTAKTDSTAGVRPLVMTAGGGTTFTQNFNLFAPGTVSRTPGAALVYEPLLAVDRSKSGVLKPWLATSHAYSDGGKTLTFKLREGVTWSDGKPFTADDVVYSLQQHKSGGAPFDTITAPDAGTVKITYAASSYGDIGNFVGARMIVPKHIWATQNQKTWTNPTPVGTGAFTLKRFSPQAVTYTLRSGYWGGKGKGVKDVQIIPSAQDAAVQSRMNAGTQDWASIGWPDVQNEYVAKDPKRHLYRFYSTGSTEGPVFNTTVAPYNDVHVRRALRDALDGPQIAKTVGIGYPAGSITGLDPAIFGSSLPAGTDKPMSQDVASAKAELAEGGWTVKNGQLVKGGKSYPLTYNVYQPYAEWVTTAQLAAAQWQSTLGLEVKVHQMGDAQFVKTDAEGAFGIDSGAATGGGTDVAAIYGQYTKANYVPIGKQATANMGRWSDATFEALMTRYAATPPDDTHARAELGRQIEQRVADQAPFIPLAVSGWKAEMNTNHWTGWPEPGAAYVPNPTLAPDAIQTLLNLSPVK